MLENDPKVSVIVTAHNYGKYLPECLDSVVRQRYENWELVIVNDGSTDNSQDVIDYYKMRFNDKIKDISLKGVGLAKACNLGILHSRGQYIIRLDADDYFDESILLVESNILDSEPNIHMVYPDYYVISQHGEPLELCRLMKANDELKLLSRSPLAAGAMYRRECYDAIGGYNEVLRYQEDYDFWIRFIDKFNVYNVNVPLMYYRKHNSSMSNNFEGRMVTRQYVKRRFIEENGYERGKNIIGVVPAMGLFRNKEKLALKELCGKPLIAYSIEEAMKCSLLDSVIVSTEDEEIAACSQKYGAVIPFIRPLELSRPEIPIEKVLGNLVDFFMEKGETVPDIIVILHYLTPFRKEKHITEGIDTLLLHDHDAVISTVEDITFHWKPGTHGLEPVGYQKRMLRQDRDKIYKENGALYCIKTSNLFNEVLLGSSVGYIEMSQKDSWRIESEFEFWVAEKYMQQIKNEPIGNLKLINQV